MNERIKMYSKSITPLADMSRAFVQVNWGISSTEKIILQLVRFPFPDSAVFCIFEDRFRAIYQHYELSIYVSYI